MLARLRPLLWPLGITLALVFAGWSASGFVPSGPSIEQGAEGGAGPRQAADAPPGAWSLVTPSVVVRSTLRGLSLLQCCDGWVVGEDGIVMTRFQGGVVTTTLAADLADVAMVKPPAGSPPSQGLAVGSGGSVFRYDASNPERPAWQVVAGYNGVCPSADLSAVVVTGAAQFAVAGGGCVARYTGSGWSRLIGIQSAGTVFNDLALSTGYLWAAGASTGQGSIMRLPNGGTTPQAMSLPAGVPAITGLAVIDDNAAWAVAGSALLRFSGGAWSVATSFPGVTLNAVAYGVTNATPPRNFAWAVGGRQIAGGWQGVAVPILQYQDGTWGQPQDVVGSGQLFTVAAFSADDFWAAGEDGRMAQWLSWAIPTTTPTATASSTATATPTATPLPAPGTWQALGGLPNPANFVALGVAEKADGSQQVLVAGSYLAAGGQYTSVVFAFSDGNWSTMASMPSGTGSASSFRPAYQDLAMPNCCLVYSAGAAAGFTSGLVQLDPGSNRGEWAAAQPLVALAGPSRRTLYAAGGPVLYSLLPLSGEQPQTLLQTGGPSFTDVSTAPDGSAWAVAADGGFATNTGGSWAYTAGGSASLAGVAALGGPAAIAVGDRIVTLSPSGSTVVLSPAQVQAMGVRALYAVDALPGATSGVTAWAVGGTPRGTAALLMAQGDPTVAANWRPVEASNAWGTLRAVRILSGSGAWAAGDGDTVLTYHYQDPNVPTATPVPTDSSVYWATPQAQPGAAALRAVAAAVDDNVWVGGSGLWRFNGNSFEPQGSLHQRFLSASFGEGRGWLARNRPRALLRDDMLATPVAPNGLARVQDLAVAAVDNGIALGVADSGPPAAAAGRLGPQGTWQAANSLPAAVGVAQSAGVAASGEAFAVGSGAAAYQPAAGAAWQSTWPSYAGGGLVLSLLPDGLSGFLGGGSPATASAVEFDPLPIGGTPGFCPWCNIYWGIGDFDGDGRDDLATSANNVWSLILGRGITGSSLSFTTAANDLGPFAAGDFYTTTGDFDGDGHEDLFASSGGGSFALSQGLVNGALHFVQVPGKVPSGTLGLDVCRRSEVSLQWYPGDFDGDGRTDLACNMPRQLKIALSRGVQNGVLTFITPDLTIPRDTNDFFAVADMDGDGRDDLVRLPDSSVFTAHLMRGLSGNTLNSVAISGDSHLSLTVIQNVGWTTLDVDGDGDADLPGYNASLNNGQGGWEMAVNDGVDGGVLRFHAATTDLDAPGTLGRGWRGGKDGDAGTVWSGDWQGSGRNGFVHWNGSALDFWVSDGATSTDGSGSPLAWQVAGPDVQSLEVPGSMANYGRVISLGAASCDEFWAGTDRGVMLHYQAGTWSAVPLDLGGDAVTDIQMLGPAEGWAVTEGGVVLHLDRWPGPPPPAPPPPTVTLEPVNGSSFLAQPALDVQFAVDVDWNGNIPDRLQYQLNNGGWVTLPYAGRYGATWTMNTGNLPTGASQLQVRAIPLVGASSQPDTGILQVHPCSSGVNCASFTATALPGTVSYSGGQSDSGAPKIAAAPVMPSWLPNIGGHPFGIPDNNASGGGTRQLAARILTSSVAGASDVHLLEGGVPLADTKVGSPWNDSPSVEVKVGNAGIEVVMHYGIGTTCDPNEEDPDATGCDSFGTGKESPPTVKVEGAQVTFSPYLEGTADLLFEDFEEWTGTGNLAIGLFVDIKKGVNLAIAVGPEAEVAVDEVCSLIKLNCNILTLTVEPRFEIGFNFTLLPAKDFGVTSSYGSLAVGVEIFFGIQGKVFTLGLYAGGVPGATVQLSPTFEFDYFTIPLYAGLKAKLFFFQFNIEASYTFCTPKDHCPGSQLARAVEGIGPGQSGGSWRLGRWELVPRTPPESGPRLVGAEPPEGVAVPMGSGTTTTQLQNGAYTYPDTTMALGPNGTALVAFVADDRNRPPGEGLEITTRYFDGAAWHAAVPVTSDARPDMTPHLAFDKNGRGIAIWQRQPSGAIPSGGPTTQFTRQLEVAWSSFDPTAGTWSAPQLLTNPTDNRMELPHGVTTSSDGVTAAWWLSGTGGGGLSGPSTTDRATWRTWNGSSWGAPQTILQQDNLSEIALDLYTAKQGLAAAVWNAGEISDTLGNELYIAAWNGSTWGAWQRLTYDCEIDGRPSVFHDQNGQAVVLWMRGGQLVSFRPGITQYPEPVPGGDSRGIIGYSGAMSPAGHIALVWTDRQSQGPYLDDFLTDTTDGGQAGSKSGPAVWRYAQSAGSYSVADSAITLSVTGSGPGSSTITRTLGTSPLTDAGVVLQARLSASSLHRFKLALPGAAALTMDDDGFDACVGPNPARCTPLAGVAVPAADTLYTLRIQAKPDNSYTFTVYGPDGSQLGTTTVGGGPLYWDIASLLLQAWDEVAGVPRSSYSIHYVYFGPPDEAPAPAANSGPGYDVFYTVFDALAGQWSSPAAMSHDFDADLYMVPVFQDDQVLQLAYTKQQMLFTSVSAPVITGPRGASQARTAQLPEADLAQAGSATIDKVLQPGSDVDVYAATHDVAGDISVAALHSSPARPRPGQVIQLGAEVSNAGDLATDPGRVVFYALPPSENAPATALADLPGATALGRVELPRLAGGERRTVSIPWTLPADLAGPLAIVARYEATGTSPAGGPLVAPRAQRRTDNDGATLQLVLPDLAVTGLRISRHDHETAFVELTVHNAGASPSLPAGLEIRRGAAGGDWPTTVLSATLPALAPGEQRPYALELALPKGLPAGEHHFDAVIIAAAGTSQARWRNDVARANYLVAGDLVFLPEKLRAERMRDGSGLRVQATIRNAGHLGTPATQLAVLLGSPLLAASNGEPAETLLQVDLPALAPGEAVAIERRLPPSAASSPVVYFQLDPQGWANEQNPLDNLAMRYPEAQRLGERAYLPVVHQR